MKTNKYIVIVLAVLTLVSCGDDDFSREYIDTEEKTALVGQLQLSRAIAAPNTELQFTVTVPQTFSVDAKVEVTGTFKVPNADLDVIRGYATVPAGATSGDGGILISMGSGPGEFGSVPEAISFAISGIALQTPEDAEPVDDPFTMTSESSSIGLIDYDANWMRILSARSLAYSVDWLNPDVNDLDVYLINEDNGLTYESSESGSRYEGDFIDDNRPDGLYGLYVSFWTAPTGEDIPYSVHNLRNDNTVDYYQGTFSMPMTGDFVGPILLYTKTTDADGNAYISTSLPN